MVDALLSYIGCTKGLHTWFHAAHQVTKGVGFAGDHVNLYGEIYNGISEDFDKLVECSKTNVRQIKGWKGSGDRRKAFLNGEIDVSRDGFSHMKKTYKGGIKSGKTKVWFSHGVSVDGKIVKDPNMPEANLPSISYRLSLDA